MTRGVINHYQGVSQTRTSYIFACLCVGVFCRGFCDGRQAPMRANYGALGMLVIA